MLSSTLFGLVCATMAAASPLKQLDKKAYKYETVTDIVWVTVTAGEIPPPVTTSTLVDTTVVVASTVYVNAIPLYGHYPHPHRPHGSPSSSSLVLTSPAVSSFSSVAPVVVTTSTSVAPVVVHTTSSVAPVVVPTTSSVAPVVVPTTSSKVATVVATTAAPVVTSSSAAAVVSSSAVPVASTTAAAAASSPTDFDSTCTYHHNIHRSNHSATAATYDATIAGYAKTLADTCVYGHDVTIGGGGYGQNIASWGATDATSVNASTVMAAMITNMWYNGEVALFQDFYGVANPTTNFDAWGHFSQIVWKGSDTVGCAVTLCAAGTIFDSFDGWFGVCNYGPEGNVAGEYADNVGRPIGSGSVTVAL
ncbi:hypothetical protein BP6252_11537 [Coleophoma cylindrospora]|uniref:SCP domain-containing protein n=1 Tax=Coleophoma cylindrospora TaxID=1849047 RepID=A0A3D8QKX2_9HELO|nr:hypothetical protein BP6252_11537 [Coleophoma cylindrospora]